MRPLALDVVDGSTRSRLRGTPKIASITGHAIEETQRILDTYCVATRQQARAAITEEADLRRRL